LKEENNEKVSANLNIDGASRHTGYLGLFVIRTQSNCTRAFDFSSSSASTDVGVNPRSFVDSRSSLPLGTSKNLETEIRHQPGYYQSLLCIRTFALG
jgi:hypothetical protein